MQHLRELPAPLLERLCRAARGFGEASRGGSEVTVVRRLK
jgi:hypothetical protein